MAGVDNAGWRPLDTLIHAIAQRLGWAPSWVLSLVVVAFALAAALAAHEVVVRLVRRAMQSREAFWRELLVRTRAPGRLAIMVLAAGWGLSLAPLSDGQGAWVRHVLVIAFIIMLGWVALTALDIGAALYLRRYRLDVEDNLLARKHVTQVRILHRALATLVMILTAGLALMTIAGVRQWGVSLLAAGGAASVIVGLALQPLLSNLMAGIQIAISQPIRIDDGVLVENEYGNVEEINATYVVVRLWDERRMILPLTYFLTKPFQNWTRQSASLVGTVMLYVDYTVPVPPLREELAKILKASPLWDGKVMSLAVTDLREHTMEVRCLVSASNSGRTFDLRAEVREKMVEFMRTHYPQGLPRERLELQTAPGRGDGLGRAQRDLETTTLLTEPRRPS